MIYFMQYYAPFNNFAWPIKTLAKIGKRICKSSKRRLFFILPIISVRSGQQANYETHQNGSTDEVEISRKKIELQAECSDGKDQRYEKDDDGDQFCTHLLSPLFLLSSQAMTNFF